MKYSENQIKELLGKLKPLKGEEQMASYSIMGASNNNSIHCQPPNGEDLFTIDCEDVRF